MKKLILAILLIPAIAFAAHQYLEKDYQKKWCDAAGGVIEYRLDDGTRVDCLTDTHAVEVEFAAKKFESVGQALFYAAKTGRKPGVLLIMEGKNDQKHLDRLNIVAEKHGIRVWIITPEDMAP